MKKLFFILILTFLPLQASACIPEEHTNTSHPFISAVYPSPLENETEWVELANDSDSIIDLGFYTLEDNTAHPQPLSGSIAAHDSMQITELSFQLNNGGDSVFLKTLDGELVDSLTYETSTAGEIILESIESVDLADDSSEGTDTSQRIPATLFPDFSEALPNPEGSDSSGEWIELYNPHSEAIDLFGLELDDEEGGSSSHTLDAIMQANAYLLIPITDSSITLNNSEDSIRLLNDTGTVLWDIHYEDPEEGQSYANFNGTYEWTDRITPGEENVRSADGGSDYADGELSEDIEISEVFPNPEGPDSEEEWIEITNGGDETVDLGNWTIDDGPDGSDPYTFPEDTVIEPGETLIIERTLSKIALNNSNESVVLKDFAGETMDEIAYEKSEEGKSYTKVKIREVKSLQASTSNLGQKVFTSWQWLDPSPGSLQNSWKQITGEILAYENNILTLFDGISTWTIYTTEAGLNELLFKVGNKMLVQITDTDNLVYSEVIETVLPEETISIPWELILSLSMIISWISFEIYKRKRLQKNLLSVA